MEPVQIRFRYILNVSDPLQRHKQLHSFFTFRHSNGGRD